MNNSNLHAAKNAKNDEFYTQVSDVEKELNTMKSFFKGKKVLCNCNDDKWSAFFKYFSANFEYLGLKQLVCVSYNENGHGIKYVYNDDGEFNVSELNGNGSFSSDECVELLKECDVVVTNPPFSLFRDFVALLQEYGKKFLIVGNQNAVTYKEIFPYFKNNKMWWGFDCLRWFIDGENNTELIEGARSRWFTNIPHDKRNRPLDLYKKYNAEEYPKFDNYDAINVNKTADIPMDWDGVIGVPITFLDKYCPTQFEIVGNLNPILNSKHLYKRILIKRIV